MLAFSVGFGEYARVAYSYLSADQDQLFLLPPDMREWLPAGHLVWLVLDVIARVDTAALHEAHPRDGVGRRAYDPEMLLALLVYAYCTGERSSRRIERLCQTDVAYRVITANLRPDHTTMARFRQDHGTVAARLFGDVLVLCAEAGLASVGVVAVDGTKMGTDASLKANRTRAQLEAEVAALLAEAAEQDAAEDTLYGPRRGDELPAEFADRSDRGARLDAALKRLDQVHVEQGTKRVQAHAGRDAALADGEALKGRPPTGREVLEADAALERARRDAAARIGAREESEAANGRKKGGKRPGVETNKHVRRARRRVEAAKAKEKTRRSADRSDGRGEAPQANTTDPDSAIMKTKDGWTQGYNAQAAVNSNGVVIAAEVTNHANDVLQCVPMISAVAASLAAAGLAVAVGMMLFDAGYCSEANITAPGPPRLIATKKSWKLRREAKEHGYRHGPPPADASPLEAMQHRLLTEHGAAFYDLRQQTVEPVFGQIKDGRGFRRFTRRGLQAARTEWLLITATHNILKLHRAR